MSRVERGNDPEAAVAAATDVGGAHDLIVDLSHPSVLEDPYPTYRALRERAPVYFDKKLNVWIVSRYNDIVRALRDTDRFSSRRMDKLIQRRLPKATPDDVEPFLGIMRLWQQMVDPPVHTRLRNVINQGFTPRSIEALRPQIERTVDTALDAMEAAGGEVEFIRSFAFPVSAMTPLQLYGVPASDLDMIDKWTQDMTVFIGGSVDPRRGLSEASASIVAMRDYFRDMVQERRKRPTDDLIGRLVHAEGKGKFASEDELCAQLTMVQAASYFTTLDMFANGLLALLRTPSSMDVIREGRTSWRIAIDELLRYDGPVQLTHRLTTEEVTIDGTTIPADSIVYLLRGSANRDPARFEDPDSLRLERGDIHHLGLGEGVHYCTGAGLARLQGEVAFERLFARFPRMTLAPGLVWRTDNLQFRGLAKLPIALA
ncbi:cytochrome P450 [Sorangium sp. So ce1153]|uniref:cytochrome P450 n=1 Tax=Sorangium sp. So ce1153 TaxID=3133333 RepID=UPI003F62B26A